MESPGPEDVPLLEFDPDRSAYIEPSALQPAVDAPPVAVACFFPEAIEELSRNGRRVLELSSREPLWEIDYKGRALGLFYPGVGAPLASSSLERVIATGCRTIIACGAAGAMRVDLKMGHHAIVVTSAIRDEGTSFHYLPPGREIVADPNIVATLSAVANKRGIPTVAGRTWTTDGLFRETPGRVAQRRAEGCVTVEMESSALFAVAAFRKIEFGQLLYAGDDLSGEVWDDRDWRQAVEMRRLLLDLAAEAALTVSDARSDRDHDPRS